MTRPQTPAPPATDMPQADSILLADGRKLCFARYGARDGRPVIYLHGAGSSRLEGEFYDRAARAAGVQLIATDRPGCGGSSPATLRSFGDYADDVRALADRLGFGRFVIAGMSNGGAFTMAVAARLPERVSAAVPINSSTPWHDRAAREATPLRVRMSYAVMRRALGLTLWATRRVAFSQASDQPARRHAQEAWRQPDSGYLAQEIRLATAPWGFDHAAVAQPVEIFSGDRDGNHGYAKVWVEQLPCGRLHVFRGGHGDFAQPDVCARIVAVMAAAP